MLLMYLERQYTIRYIPARFAAGRSDSEMTFASGGLACCPAHAIPYSLEDMGRIAILELRVVACCHRYISENGGNIERYIRRSSDLALSLAGHRILIMKFTSRILPVAGFMVALAIGGASQSLSTVIQSMDRVTTAYSNLYNQIELVTNAAETRSISGGLNGVAEAVTKEEEVVPWAEWPDRFTGENALIVIDEYYELVKTVHDMLAALINKHDLVEPSMDSDIVEGLRETEYSIEIYLISVERRVDADWPGGPTLDDLKFYFESTRNVYST
ncbi:hypothetical protein OH77DRAFT_1425138 [Trametes cingulata]|nr:hypothetical protein OH77DRAFT_1425138 [Trametes cingulata]